MKSPLRLVVALSFSAMALPLTTATAGAVTKSADPQCIVSLSPTATNTLFAIGAGPQVQAVDEYSNYPAAAQRLSRRHRINALSPSLEGILGICKVTKSQPSTKPDLVVLSYDPSDFEQKLVAMGIKVVDLNAATSVANALSQIRELGHLSGHVKRADALALSLKTTINNDIASVPAHPKKRITVYYEISHNPYYSLTSSTFVGSLMKSLGLVNIADADSTTADAGYPELNPEYIVSANPELIFLAGDASASSVGHRPGWAHVSAVIHHNVIELNADIASQWGPRLGTLMKELTSEVKHVLKEQK